jgi:hypothetical protein
MVAPLAIVEKSDAFFALPPRWCVGPIYVDDRFIAFSPAQSLLPHLGPNAVRRVHQPDYILIHQSAS